MSSFTVGGCNAVDTRILECKITSIDGSLPEVKIGSTALVEIDDGGNALWASFSSKSRPLSSHLVCTKLGKNIGQCRGEGIDVGDIGFDEKIDVSKVAISGAIASNINHMNDQKPLGVGVGPLLAAGEVTPLGIGVIIVAELIASAIALLIGESMQKKYSNRGTEE